MDAGRACAIALAEGEVFSLPANISGTCELGGTLTAAATDRATQAEATLGADGQLELTTVSTVI